MGPKNSDNEENDSLKVKDKRSSNMDTEETKENDEVKRKASEKEKKEFDEASDANTVPEINFSMHVITLYQQACFYLGIKMEHPDAPEPQVNLPVADINIKTLSMLQEKTANNLTPEEAQLVEQVLYDLKMKYIAKTKEMSSI